jgi:Domain of unknown function (DUF4402)
MIGENRLIKGARFACAAAVAICTISTPVLAETEAVDAQVAIVERGTFFKVEDLHFGAIVPSGTAGTVVVTPAGARTATGGVTLFGNLHHPAEFAGRKPSGNRPVEISVGSNTIQLTGPGAPMTVRLFNGNTNPGQTFITTPRNFQVQGQSNGAFELRVGATLDVNANQAPGLYTGTWTLTLDFQ